MESSIRAGCLRGFSVVKTELPATLLDTEKGRRANEILRSCVHCGFCNATCPTYQLFGDETDGPRGRIYLIKQMLEGNPVSERTRRHLDRCLTCRNCETTCPSGVEYHELLDIGREYIENTMPRPLVQRLQRKLLLASFPYTRRFAMLTRMGQIMRPLLPTHLRSKLPKPGKTRPAVVTKPHARKMLLLDGCVQPVLQPGINAVLMQLLDSLGIETVISPNAGCCGAMAQHLADTTLADRQMKANIDAWWPAIEAGAEAIVSTASGCGLMLKEYGELLKHDPGYAGKAARVSSLAKDIVEVLSGEDLSAWRQQTPRRIAFHPPCTLQHGQRLTGQVESLLRKLGYELVPVRDSHLCCGSAGTYSLFQPEIAMQLRDNKLDNLQAKQPELIATANIGCQEHLRSGSDLPVIHWIELLAPPAKA